MKKYLFIILISLTSTPTFSQIRIGFQGGLNLNDLESDEGPGGEDLEDTKFRAGFNLGVMADVALSEQFSFQPSLIYTSKGTSINNEILQDSDYGRLKLNYLEVPLLFNYSFTDQFSGFAGPYFAYGLGGVTKIKFDGEKEEIDYKTIGGEIDASEYFSVEEEYFNSVDYGLNFGVGFNLSESATIRLGYSLGLNNLNVDIIDDTDDGIDDSFDADDEKAFNRVLSLSFIYFLN